MYKVKWDAQNNGIILSDNISDEEAIPAPRPVYLQELQILEVDKNYRLPKTDKPICWNIDARYYYKGQPFFERRGAGIYSKPTVVYNSGFTFATLEAVDVDKLIDFLYSTTVYSEKDINYVVSELLLSSAHDGQNFIDAVSLSLDIERLGHKDDKVGERLREVVGNLKVKNPIDSFEYISKCFNISNTPEYQQTLDKLSQIQSQEGSEKAYEYLFSELKACVGGLSTVPHDRSSMEKFFDAVDFSLAMGTILCSPSILSKIAAACSLLSIDSDYYFKEELIKDSYMNLSSTTDGLIAFITKQDPQEQERILKELNTDTICKIDKYFTSLWKKDPNEKLSASIVKGGRYIMYETGTTRSLVKKETNNKTKTLIAVENNNEEYFQKTKNFEMKLPSDIEDLMFFISRQNPQEQEKILTGLRTETIDEFNNYFIDSWERGLTMNAFSRNGKYTMLELRQIEFNVSEELGKRIVDSDNRINILTKENINKIEEKEQRLNLNEGFLKQEETRIKSLTKEECLKEIDNAQESILKYLELDYIKRNQREFLNNTRTYLNNEDSNKIENLILKQNFQETRDYLKNNNKDFYDQNIKQKSLTKFVSERFDNYESEWKYLKLFEDQFLKLSKQENINKEVVVNNINEVNRVKTLKM